MSEEKASPAASQSQVDLVLANTVSRLGCTIAQAREHLAKQSAEATKTLTPAKPAQPSSKGGTDAGSGDEALL